MRLNKALGQNFFNNPGLADWIVEQALYNNPKSIIEIGPGDGYFSSRLASRVENLILIEKDKDLAEFLSQKIQKAIVHNEDILGFNLAVEKYSKPLNVYGSLPYNISKRIISMLIKLEGIDSMTFIVQKEVAQKYIQSDGNSSLLSLTTELYADVKMLKIVKPGNFIPKPKVDSAVITITPNSNRDSVNTRSFEKLIKLAFAKPRKTLRNNLKSLDIKAVPEELLLLRPERLNFHQYKDLSNQIVL